MNRNASHQTFPSSPRCAALLSVIALCAFILGAQTALAQSGPRKTITRLKPTARTIHAIPGRTLVFRVQPASGNPTAWLPAASHTIRTDSGDQLDFSLHYITALYPFPEPGDWLNPPGHFSALTLEQATIRLAEFPRDTEWLTRGFWVARVPITEQHRPHSLLLDGQRLPITWVEPPPLRTDPTRAPTPDAPPEVRRALGQRLGAYNEDPNTRWRTRLLTDRVRPAALWGNNLPPARINPPVVENFAAQIEDRWRAAISAVERGDKAAAARLLARLTAIARMPDGSLLPAWAHDASGEAQLLSVLLDPTLPVSRHVAAAEAFVSAQPRAVAWVIDEAAPASNRPFATVAITNLTDTIVMGDAASSPAARNADSPIAPHTSQSFIAVSDSTSTDDVFEIYTRAGDWRASLASIPAGIPATPPGVRIAPLVAPWSVHSWLAQSPQAMPSSRATAAMLFPEPEVDAWRLYIECASPTDTPPSGFVRLWFGQRNDPRAVITIHPDGRAFDETLGSPIPLPLVSQGTLPQSAMPRTSDTRNRKVAEAIGATGNSGSAGGWWAMVRLPISAYEPNGSLVMAMERIDSDGYRSTWPRPVLPQQEEPGRVRIDLGAWD